MQPLRKWKNRSERKDRKTERYITKTLKNKTTNKSKPTNQTNKQQKPQAFNTLCWFLPEADLQYFCECTLFFTRGRAICSILGLKHTHFVGFYPRQTCSVRSEMQRFLFHYWRIAVCFYFSPYLPPQLPLTPTEPGIKPCPTPPGNRISLLVWDEQQHT